MFSRDGRHPVCDVDGCLTDICNNDDGVTVRCYNSYFGHGPTHCTKWVCIKHRWPIESLCVIVPCQCPFAQKNGKEKCNKCDMFGYTDKKTNPYCCPKCAYKKAKSLIRRGPPPITTDILARRIAAFKKEFPEEAKQPMTYKKFEELMKGSKAEQIRGPWEPSTKADPASKPLGKWDGIPVFGPNAHLNPIYRVWEQSKRRWEESGIPYNYYVKKREDEKTRVGDNVQSAAYRREYGRRLKDLNFAEHLTNRIEREKKRCRRA